MFSVLAPDYYSSFPLPGMAFLLYTVNSYRSNCLGSNVIPSREYFVKYVKLQRKYFHVSLSLGYSRQRKLEPELRICLKSLKDGWIDNNLQRCTFVFPELCVSISWRNETWEPST